MVAIVGPVRTPRALFSQKNNYQKDNYLDKAIYAGP